MAIKQMIEDIANIQYYVKTIVYDESINNKEQYTEKVRDVYKNASIDEIKENLEEVKYLAVGAIKLNIKKKIESNCMSKKLEAYEEYLNKCKSIEIEMKEKLKESKELRNLTADSVISYINRM